MTVDRKEAFRKWKLGDPMTDVELQLVVDGLQTIVDVFRDMGEHSILLSGLYLSLNSARNIQWYRQNPLNRGKQ